LGLSLTHVSIVHHLTFVNKIVNLTFFVNLRKFLADRCILDNERHSAFGGKMMKRSLLFLVFAAIITSGAFSDSLMQIDNNTQNNSCADNLFSEYTMFIPLSINSNYFSQNKEESFMPWKLSLFSSGNVNKAENTKWLAFALNLFLGFGIGSFVQGDIDGGIISILGAVGGYALIIVGSVRMTNALYNDIYYWDGHVSFAGVGFLIAGSVILLGTKIFDAIRPFVYASNVSVAFSPGIDANGQPTFAVMGKVAY